jgi:NADH-quinone oxidoreductase subunit H
VPPMPGQYLSEPARRALPREADAKEASHG